MAILSKKNKFKFLALTCFLFLVLNGTAVSEPVGLVPPPAPVSSTLYVGGIGNYTTIQAAVNNASSGDTIIVNPGTYTEVVDIAVSNLTIRSFSGNPEDTIVRTFSPSHNFKIIANNVTISGFNITGEGYYTGVFITGVSGANVINNKFSGNDCAIQMEGSTGCNLINNTVSDSTSYGFYLWSSNNCILANNTISSTSDEGIYLYSSGSCVLTGNTVSDTGNNGIYLTYSSSCNLSDNTVSNIDYDGIYLYNSGSCVLNGNTISNIVDTGIFLYSSSGCNLIANTVSDIDDCGIDLHYSGNCTLSSNTVSNSEYECVYLYSSSGCTLSGNTVSNSTDDGIYLEYSGSCNLTNNAVSNIDDDGIYLYNSGSSILINNTVSDSDYGITVGYSDECVLRNNTASSGRYGISIWDVQNCTLTGNIMSENWYNLDFDPYYYYYDLDSATGNTIDTSNLVDGKAVYYLEGDSNPSIGTDAGIIYCINCGDVEIKDYVLQNNSFGVFLYNTSSEMENNTITNTEDGIVVLSSQDVRLSDSRVDNSWAGIIFEEDTNITLTDNTVRNSTYGIVTYESENCTVTGNFVQDATESSGLPASVNSGLVSGEESTSLMGGTLVNSNLVQSRGIYGYGIYSEYCQDIRLEDNAVKRAGLVGIYFEDCQDAVIASNSVRDVGYMGFYSYNCTSVEFMDNTIRNVTGTYDMLRSVDSPLVSSPLVSSPLVSVSYNGPLGYGICFDEIQDFRFEGNTVEDSYQVWGIYLYEPVNATLRSNTLESCMLGLAAYDGYNCSVSDFSVTNCSSGGILIENFPESTGAEYTVTGCTVDGSDIGMLITGESILADNTLSGNSYGLVLYDMNNSLICGNTMVENSLAGLAIDLDQTEIWSRLGLVGSVESPESGNNTIYNNYFNNVNNTLIYSEANNTWNTSKISGESIVGGPYLGGNYWANPSGTGFSENCTDADKDGIADSSYEIVNGTFDYLPLTEIPSTTTRHRSSANYIPSSAGSTGVTGIDSAQKRVAAGSEAIFSFSNPVSGIMGLSFTSAQYSGNVIVRIELLEAGSGDTPEGQVYQLMNILVGNERFESGDNINGASLNFRVSKSWVEENNIDVSSITINRFHDEEWNSLPTEMTSEDEEYYYFTAETPGFSKYAITGDKLGSVVLTPTEEETGTITGEEQTAETEKSAPGFESTFALLGILASVFFAKKRILK